MKIPETIKSVGFVSGDQLCHGRKMRATRNKFLLRKKKERPDTDSKVLFYVLLQTFEPGEDTNPVSATWPGHVQTSVPVALVMKLRGVQSRPGHWLKDKLSAPARDRTTKLPSLPIIPTTHKTIFYLLTCSFTLDISSNCGR
jgi:hypothetical protein